METQKSFVAFVGTELIARGSAEELLPVLKARQGREEAFPLLVFDRSTGRQVDFDLRGSLEDCLARLSPAPAPKAGPGRPRLGVQAGEVTLLPRHWEWLAAQPLKASGTIRRLVEEAMSRVSPEEEAKRRRDAAGTFLWIMAGNLPGFEEASRALYAGRVEDLRTLMDAWPKDVREEALRMLEG